ncbi:hypothetical protein EZV62_025322 [Acer yangbiense]|uniref:Uncharacterized protein n=1 Tax=Acer yangbiense TaxID=1000413 RepID=A0A5C7GY74_9ROSI|nr:hypothetical protein EZV62_025322 [Acer yangbiense]
MNKYLISTNQSTADLSSVGRAEDCSGLILVVILRFSDGKLVPDFIASTLRIKEAVPPFLQPNLSDHELLSGVTFASAGSGWDELTTLATSAIPVSMQIDMFKDYLRRVKRIVSDDQEKAKKIISGALVVISTGTNDFGLNFYGIPTRRFQFIAISAYQDFLLNNLQSFVKDLWKQREGVAEVE